MGAFLAGVVFGILFVACAHLAHGMVEDAIRVVVRDEARRSNRRY